MKQDIVPILLRLLTDYTIYYYFIQIYNYLFFTYKFL